MPDPSTAAEGAYLPGPPGTNGDFWVGDIVRVHTGSGPFDYDEVDARVMAITITIDDDNGELIVIPELKVLPPPPVPVETHAILWQPGGSGTSFVPGWSNSGDNFPPGETAWPMIGPIHGLGTYPPVPHVAFCTGIGIDGTGTLDIHFIASVYCIFCVGLTITWSVRKNGVDIGGSNGTYIAGPCGDEQGCNVWSWDFWVLGVAVVPGDTLDAYVSVPGTDHPGMPSGTGQGEMFRVSGWLTPP